MPKFESYLQGTPCYVELTSPDAAKGAAYYAALLGWEIKETPLPPEVGGAYRQGLLQGDTIAGISGPMPGMEEHPGFWAVYLAVDDVDAATAKVAAAGGTVDAGPFDVTDVGRMSAIQDPTGARVNLWQAGTSIGSERANEDGTVVWNELITTDVDRALAFYADVVDLGTEVMEVGGEKYTCVTNTGGAVVGAAAPPFAEGVPPHWNVYFQVADVDAAGARAVELGGSVVADNVDVPDIGRMGFYADDQGAMFALMQPPAAS